MKFLAVNEVGLKSDFSNELIFSLGSLPSQPNPIEKDPARSSGDSIMLKWDKITTDSLATLGYRLYADTGRNEPLRLIYDGSNNAQITEFLFTRAANRNETISSKLWYRFQVAAVNFNGEGPRSSIVSLQCCTSPSRLSAPSVLNVNSQSVSLLWEKPVDDGGCKLTSYHIYMREVGQASWEEVDPETVPN